MIKPKTDTTVNQQLWAGPIQNYVILPRICEWLDLRKGFGFIRIFFFFLSLDGFLLCTGWHTMTPFKMLENS